MCSNTDEKIIEMVRSHIELYDLSHPKYMDSAYKDDIWKSIGNELNITGKICKTRWNNIRDNYRKSIKKTTSGQASTKIKKYKYYDHLQFLKPHFQERDTLGNVKDVNSDSLKIIENAYSDSEDDTENVSNDQCIDISGNTGDNKLSQIPEPQHIRKSTQKRTYKTLESASSTLMKYIMQKKENNISTQTHSVDAFLAGLSPTLKSFSPYYLNIVKSKKFSIVQEYEMKMIVDEEKKKTPFMTPYLSHFLPPQQQFHQNIPSSATLHLNHNTPSPNESNFSSSPPSPQVSRNASFSNTKHIIKMPQDTSSPTTSQCSSTPPSPQFIRHFASNSINSTYLPAPEDTLTPTSNQYSSSPPSPFLNENIGPSITQNNSHLQKTQNTVLPTLSTLQSQFDQNISNNVSKQQQQEIYTNLYTTMSHKLNKNKRTKTYIHPSENEASTEYYAQYSNIDNN